MRQEVQIPLPGGSAPAYLASAAKTGARCVLVLHPWWGLNEFMHSLCDRLALEGITALAPDLYHGATARTIPEAKALRNNLDRNLAGKEIIAAADHLQQIAGDHKPQIGLVGFSLGAYLGMGAVEKRPAAFGAVVLFYGGRRVKLNKTKAAFLAHFAENDPYVSENDRQALAEQAYQAGLEATMHIYPGTGHWFFEDDRQEAYQPAAAQLAWQRTLDFLKTKLVES
jgi:carboxymethylenebutenolidase